jgi:TraG P-loop domain
MDRYVISRYFSLLHEMGETSRLYLGFDSISFSPEYLSLIPHQYKENNMKTNNQKKALLHYKDIFPFKGSGGTLLFSPCGRVRFIFKIIEGYNPELHLPEQLAQYSNLFSNFYNTALPTHELMQTFILSTPDSTPLLDNYLDLMRTDNEFLHELEKERCRFFDRMTRGEMGQNLSFYICAGFDPYADRRQDSLGFETPDLFSLLRLNAPVSPSGDPIPAEIIIDDALNYQDQVSSFLESAGLKVKVLERDEINLLLQQSQLPDVTFLGDVPETPYIGKYSFYPDYILQTYQNHKRYYSCLVPKNLPQYTFPGFFSSLLANREITRLSITTYRSKDTANELSMSVKKSLNDFSTAFEALIGRNTTTESTIQQQEIELCKQKIFQEKTHILHTGIVVVLSANSLEDLRAKIKRTIDEAQKQDMTLEVALKWQEDLWLASLPGSPVPPPISLCNRCFPDNTANLSLPVMLWSGSQKPNFLLTNRWGQLLPYDFFSLSSSHGIVAGKTGKGKSVNTLDIALRAAAIGARTAIIDKYGSYEFAVKHVIGGMARSMEPGTFTINPFEFYIPSGLDIRQVQVPPNRIEVLKSFFITVLGKQNEDDNSLRAILNMAIDLTYHRILPEERYPVITDMIDSMRSLAEGNGIPEIQKEFLTDGFKDLVRNVLIGLYEFHSAGSMEYLVFNGQSSEKFFNHDHIYFDLQPLGKGTRTQRLVSQLLAGSIDEWVQSFPNRKTFLIFDEIWSDLTDNPQMAGFMTSAVRAYRRFGVRVFFVTQSFSDIIDSPYSNALFQQTSIRFCLGHDSFEVVASDLKANYIAVQTINQLVTQQGHFAEAFLFFENERTSVIIWSTPMRYWVSTTDSKDTPWRNYFVEKLGYSPKDTIRILAMNFPHGISDDSLFEEFKAGNFELQYPDGVTINTEPQVA